MKTHHHPVILGRRMTYVILALVAIAGVLLVLRASELANTSYPDAVRSDDTDYQLQKLQAKETLRATVAASSTLPVDHYKPTPQ